MERSTLRLLIESLNRDAERIARRFSLRLQSIEAERANVRRRYGVCDSDGAIKIRLRHAVTGRPLKYSSLVNTLCHELAHLRHFNHGPRFKGFYLELLEFARAQGIYRPAGPGARRDAPQRLERPLPSDPAQLSLFS
jgi:predicted metal-dependent hydrolase